jgi:hypothetical protein
MTSDYETGAIGTANKWLRDSEYLSRGQKACYHAVSGRDRLLSKIFGLVQLPRQKFSQRPVPQRRWPVFITSIGLRRLASSISIDTALLPTSHNTSQ